MTDTLRYALTSCALATALLALTSLAAAQDAPVPLQAGDYGLENREWNGLSTFVAMAESRGLEIRAGSGLDLSKLGPEDRLIVVYPTRELDEQAIARFVIDGGKVLLVDDFGASTGFLDRLGIQRVEDRVVQHEAHYQGLPGLPIFRPKGKHALLSGVNEVVANHPSVLTTRGGAILPYDTDGLGLVYDMRLARGKVIVVGDASLMINHMLRVADNETFIGNCLEYLCKDQPDCRPYLLVGDFALTGTYKPHNRDDDDIGDFVSSAFDAINDGLDNLEDYVPPHNAVYYASLLLMGGLVIFMVTIFPMRRAPRVAPQAGPPPGVHPLSEFEWNVQRFERTGYQANYALPVAILKVDFERVFFDKVASGERLPPHGDSSRPAALRRLSQRYVDLYLADLSVDQKVRQYKTTLNLLQVFSRLPPRHRLFLDSEARFTERDMMRIYRQCRAIMKTLGVEGLNDSK